MCKISFFKAPITNVHPYSEMSIQEIANIIKSDYYKNVTEKLRSQDTKEDRDLCKREEFDYVTFSGLFKKRSNAELIQSSNYLVIDMDYLENPSSVKEILIQDRFLPMVLGFFSPSGKGLKAVYKIDLLQAAHLQWFNALNNYLLLRHGINVDPSGKDIARACFLCHDSEVYYNSFPEAMKEISHIEEYNRFLLIKKNVETVHKFLNGGRNNFIKHLAGACNRQGINLDLVEEAIVNEYQQDGFCSDEISRTIRSMYSRTDLFGINLKNKRSSKSREYPENRRNSVKIDWATELLNYKINPLEVLPKPPSIISMLDSSGEYKSICSLGNFSLIIGKAKSRKTFLITAFAASAITGNSLVNILGSLPEDKKRTILIDTEQSKYDVYNTVRRICKQAGLDRPNYFDAYGLRSLSPSERLECIDFLIKNTPDLAFVIVDGLRDLLGRGINNEVESSDVISMVMKWTHEYNIHMMFVLHQNKGDLNARGHIGTEAVNKAETTLSVTKHQSNKDVSVINPEYCRGVDFAPFMFTINAEGVPEVFDGSKLAAVKHREVDDFKALFLEGKPLPYKALVQTYEEQYSKSTSTAKRKIREALACGILKLSDGEYSFINQDDVGE